MKYKSRNPQALALAIIGDRYHNSDYIRTALGRTLVKEAGLSIDFTDEVTAISHSNLAGYRMLIVFRDGMVWPNGYGGKGHYPGYVPGQNRPFMSDPPVSQLNVKPQMWMTPSQGKAVRDFVDDGQSAFFFHNTSHISLSNLDFRDVEGAVYTGHPPVRPFKVHIEHENHPITRGVKTFIVTDEQHYVQYDKEPRNVLLRSENIDGLPYSGTIGDQGPSCEAGWAYEYGKGRVCFMAPGHMIPVLWNPEYRKLQKNAVKWLLKEQ